MPMQGPSETGREAASSNAGIASPISAKHHRADRWSSARRYDTMDPAHMEMMASGSKKGRYLYLPQRQPPRDV